MSSINSVLGPLDTGKLGFTLPHEHITASSAGLPFTYPEVIDRDWVLAAAVEDLIRARNGGVATMVDVSPIDLGRDVELMREVSSQSGMQLICSTGCWLDVPRSFWGRSPDYVASLWIREIEEGIERTGIKAGIIKVATSDPIQDSELLMLRASARAHKQTGVPITTHTPRDSQIGEEQIRILQEEGVDPCCIYIGHVCNTLDLAYHERMLDKEVYLGWDIYFPANRPGTPTWEQRTDFLVDLLNKGYVSQIMLSHDWTIALGYMSPGYPSREENPDGYLWITHKVLPRIRELGISEDVITQMTVENPRRYFEGT